MNVLTRHHGGTVHGTTPKRPMQLYTDHWGIIIVGYCGFVGLIIIIIIIVTSVCLACAIIAKVTTLGHTFVITSILLLRENTTHEPICGTTINNNRAEYTPEQYYAVTQHTTSTTTTNAATTATTTKIQ